LAPKFQPLKQKFIFPLINPTPEPKSFPFLSSIKQDFPSYFFMDSSERAKADTFKENKEEA